ncbi:MAG: radical SAM protein [Aigarchaeota archaeon]|nr:radical SAM protein [Candidatus Pelearchaeum maunauluense]
MTDAVLIFPYFDDKRSRMFKFPPLGIGYIASYLRAHGYSVKIVDCTFLTWEKALAEARQAKPRIIGIYSMLSMVKPALKLAEELRDDCELLVAGGPMPSAYPQKFLETFDLVAQGEAEETMLELLQALDGERRIEEIRGLHISKRALRIAGVAHTTNGGGHIFTGQRPLIKDLDRLPFPARDLYDNTAYQQYYQQNYGYTMTSMIASRGCPFCCDFCVTEDSIVVGNPGTATIPQIKTGMKVLTHTASFKEVTHTFRRKYRGKLLRIKPWLVGLEIKITPEHEVFALPREGVLRNGRKTKIVFNPEFIPAHLLESGDYLCIPIIRKNKRITRLNIADKLASIKDNYRMRNLLPDEPVERIYELHGQGTSKSAISRLLGVEQDTVKRRSQKMYKARLEYSKLDTRYSLNRQRAPAELSVTPELCRLIGYYLAEGNVSSHPRHSNSLTLQLTFDAHERKLVRDAIRLVRRCLKVRPIVASNQKNKTARVQINSVVLGLFFSLMFGGGSAEKRLPDEMLFLPRKLQSEIIRGLFLGDGYLRRDGSEFTFKTASRTLAHQLYLILLRLRISASIHIRHYSGKAKAPYYVFSIKGKSLNKLLKILGIDARVKMPSDSPAIFYRNYLLVPIREVEEVDFDGDVYNLEVRDDESYTVNFFAVHNCWRPDYGRVYRVRSPENVVDEMEEIRYRYGYERIWFADELFIANKKHVLRLCEEIRRRGLDVLWECLARVDLVDSEIAHAMRRAGCHKVIFGLESGDDRTLKTMNKHITVEQSRRAVETMVKAGIKVGAFFILGYPGETNETMLNTIRFASSLPLDYFSITIPYPLPGTGLYERVKDRLVAEEWEKPAHGWDHKLLFKHDFSTEKLRYGIWMAITRAKLRNKLGPLYAVLKPWEIYTEYKFRRL